MIGGGLVFAFSVLGFLIGALLMGAVTYYRFPSFRIFAFPLTGWAVGAILGWALS